MTTPSPFETSSDLVEAQLAEQTVETGESKPTRARSTSPAGGITRQQASKVIGKYVELSKANSDARAILAASLGVDADPAEIAATIASTTRVNVAPITDLLALADTAAKNTYDALLEAIKLDREQVKAIWQILTIAGLVTTKLPARETNAAVELARAAENVTDKERKQLKAARNLAKK